VSRTRLTFAAVALVLFGAACIALGEPATDTAAVALAVPALPAPRRCPYCGWIDSKRQLAPLSGDPHALRSYEYTVRMGDGSSRVFREQLPVSWRLGERLVFIDGAVK
jgi:hypothetical protein